MSKDAINQYDKVAANNTDVGAVNTSETMVPSAVNDAFREVMSHLADVNDGTEQLASPSISGNLTVSGTVDGRDVATDGTKLDGVAASANNYVHPNHSGEVTSTADGATVIASNVVDEDNLKVSNSPTDGYVITAASGVSGGMTWAAAAGGATDINGLSDAKKLNTTTYAIGTSALNAMSAADDDGDNLAIGFQAGAGTDANGSNKPYRNIFIGSNAGHGVSQTGTTHENIAIGWRALYLHEGVSGSVLIGKSAGENLSNCYFNTGIGHSSLAVATTASQCTNIGRYSGRRTTTGSNNSFYGYDSGGTNTTGSNCSTFGYQASSSSATVSNEVTLGNDDVTKFRVPGVNFTVKDTTATDNYVLTVDANGEAGWEAAGGGGASDIDGLSDALTHSSGDTIGLGTGALASDDGSSTNNNTAVGKYSLYSTTSGEKNTAIGFSSGLSNTTGSNNTFLGAYSGQIGTLTGSGNTAIGSTSLRQIQGAASDNIGCGYWSGYSFTTGSNNIMLGRQAMYNATTAASNVAIGREAGSSLTTATSNVILGAYAGSNATVEESSVFIGYQAGKGSSGSASYGYNVAIGLESLYSHNGVYGSVAIGALAGKLITTGLTNTTIGYLAGSAVTTGASNTCLGFQAGDSVTTGSRNTILGYGAAASSATVSDEITLGNSSISSLRCQVQSISALSDRRDKKDIEELPLGIDFINTLKPVKFTWNMRDGAKIGQQEAGFIAQDLDEAQIDADAEDYLSLVLKNNPEKLEASYGKLVPVLVKAVQELSAQIATLKKEIKNG